MQRSCYCKRVCPGSSLTCNINFSPSFSIPLSSAKITYCLRSGFGFSSGALWTIMAPRHSALGRVHVNYLSSSAVITDNIRASWRAWRGGSAGPCLQPAHQSSRCPRIMQSKKYGWNLPTVMRGKWYNSAIHHDYRWSMEFSVADVCKWGYESYVLFRRGDFTYPYRPPLCPQFPQKIQTFNLPLACATIKFCSPAECALSAGQRCIL